MNTELNLIKLKNFKILYSFLNVMPSQNQSTISLFTYSLV